jgi:hypothetical protein
MLYLHPTLIVLPNSTLSRFSTISGFGNRGNTFSERIKAMLRVRQSGRKPYAGICVFSRTTR